MSYDLFEAPQDLTPPTPVDPFSVPRPDLSYGAAVEPTRPTASPAATPAAVTSVVAPSNANPTPVESPSTAGTNAGATTGTTGENNAPAARTVHSRRRAVALGVLAALGIMFYNGDVKLPGAIPELAGVQAAKPGQPDDQTTAKARAMLSSMLGQAAAIRSQTGTFRGITFPADVQTMRSDNMLVLSTVVNGSCWYAAIMPGFDPIPRWDPTAMRCSLDRMKTLQADVDNDR